ncbi:MAG: tRNA ((46)-N7)-methyltransferase TrmB [Rhodospirillales bacterium]|nr:tRNA ((46)-N7)-methyltransferase TrmB [Rhodospirillales bacterium]
MTSPPIGRVYGRRRGRTLKGKASTLYATGLNALSVVLPEPPAELNPTTLFETAKTATWIEIGFGGGEHLATQAAAHPEIGFIGCEPFINGVSSLLVLLDEQESQNVRVFSEDARLLLRALPEGSIGRAFLLFPDPWPKRRHEGRRFVNPEALDLLARALADGAELRVATDHAILQEWMPARIAKHPAFVLVDHATVRPEGWAPTRYEAKALRAGRRPIYLAYRRRSRLPEF